MTEQHPITPSPELMEAWSREVNYNEPTFAQVAIKAARWGADQELEACIDFVRCGPWCSEKLRAARRPKPPSLKEQALEALMKADGADHPVPVLVLPVDEAALIRRALEQLDD